MRRWTPNLRVFALLALTVELPLLLFWGIFYNYFSAVLYARSAMQFETVCDGVAAQLGEAIDAMENFSQYLLTDETAVSMSTEYHVADYLQLRKYADSMNMIVDSIPYVKDAFIYFRSRNLVISSFSSFSSLEHFYGTFLLMNGLDLPGFQAFLSDNSNFRPTVNTAATGAEVPLRQSSEVVMLLTGEYKSIKGNKSNIVCVFIDLSYFADLLGVHPDEIVMAAEEIDYAEMKAVSEAPVRVPGTNTFKRWIDGQETLMFEARVQGVLLSFGLPSAKVTDGVSRSLVLFSAVLNVSAALILALIYYYYFRASRPVKRMYELFRNVEVADRSFFDLEYKVIEAGIGSLKAEQEQAVSVVRRFSENFKDHYLSGLLHDPAALDASNAELALKLAGCDLSGERFLCVMLDWKESEEALKKLMKDFESGGARVVSCRERNGEYVNVVLNADDENELWTVYDAFHDAVAERSPDSSAYAGKSVSGLMSLHEGRKAALEEMAGAVGGQDAPGQDAMEKLELKMYNALLDGNAAHAKSILDRMLEIKFDQAPLNASSLRGFYRHLLPLIKTAVRSAGERADAHGADELDSINSISGMVGFMSKLFDGIASENRKASGGSQLKTRFLDYIDRKILDPSLSLSSAADALKVHRVYLSNFVGKTFGCGFVDIVTNRRVEIAKGNLEHTNLPIAQVAELSGFGSEVTFRREFKRIHGVTPSMYRKMRQNGEDRADT